MRTARRICLAVLWYSPIACNGSAVGEDEEALAGRRFAKAGVRAHECMPCRSVRDPHQRGATLHRIHRPQRMSSDESERARSDRTQRGEPRSTPR